MCRERNYGLPLWNKRVNLNSHRRSYDGRRKWKMNNNLRKKGFLVWGKKSFQINEEKNFIQLIIWLWGKFYKSLMKSQWGCLEIKSLKFLNWHSIVANKILIILSLMGCCILSTSDFLLKSPPSTHPQKKLYLILVRICFHFVLIQN